MTTDTWQEVERNVSALLAADAYEWPKGHYLELGFGTRNQDGVQINSREFFPLVSIEETLEDALDRYVEDKLGDRQRNRAKAAERIRNQPMYVRLTRPTSFYRAEIDARNARSIDVAAIHAAVADSKSKRRR